MLTSGALHINMLRSSGSSSWQSHLKTLNAERLPAISCSLTMSKSSLLMLYKRVRDACRYFAFVSGAIQEAIEVALLTYFYLPWLWDQADAVAWYLAKHISWFHHNEIWGELCPLLLCRLKISIEACGACGPHKM